MNSDSSSENLLISENFKIRNSRSFIWQIIFPIIGGFMFGYDTGVISGALLLIRDHFHLSTISQEIVVSGTVLSAALSSLITGWLSDWIGRKKTIIISCICFIIGSIIMGISQNFIMLVFGRIFVGFGVGISAACCPVYIAEVSPHQIRGRLIVIYQISITGGMFFAALVDASFFYLGKEGWRYMLGGAAIPSFIEFIGMLTVPESYRWLLSKNKVDEARTIIVNQGQVPEERITEYIDEIVRANQQIQMQVKEHEGNSRSLIFQIFRNDVARRSLLIGCGLQMLQQIIGINTIMYYTALVIRMSGVKDISTILWLSALVAFFNFIPSFIGFILIDKIGRRKLSISSLCCVLLSLITIAITFQVLVSQSEKVTYPSNNYCGKKINCEECVTSSACGFCYIPNAINKSIVLNTSCLATQTHFSKYSSSGWCSQNATHFVSNAIWNYDFCVSKYSWVIIVGLILYLISFSIGMGPIPWAITSEIYPLWCRSTNMALSTSTNWVFNLIVSLTFLSLTEAITKYGTFWLYSSFAFFGILFIYKFVPETNQRSLEEINDLLIHNS
uniref:Slc2a-10 n=1 Tax=Schmidtea mediterranea TaxID=79327 RepID=A0A0H3YIU7_SCHMD|nr:slc2a-10 [Schmidtea mediterranea]